MINVIYLTCEILAFLQVLHSFNDKKIKLNKELIVLFLADISIFSLINYGILNENFQFVVYLILITYIVHQFDVRFIEQILNVTLSFILIVFLQVVLTYLVHNIETYWLKYILVNGLLLFSTNCITNKWNLCKFKYNIVGYKIYIGTIIIMLTLVSVTPIIVSKVAKHFSFLECLLVVCIIIILGLCMVIGLSGKKIIDAKQRELSLITLCNESFQGLLDDVRSKQHEFDNKINMLYSMHYVYSSYDELVSHQKKYSQEFVVSNKFNKLLTTKVIPVIKGYLYNKFQIYEKEGIKIEYLIFAPNINDVKMSYNIIECMGILLDNAYEAVSVGGVDNPQIYVELKEYDGNVKFEISNISPYICFEDINKFFKRGYSTKGLDRGIGLYNLERIVKEYKGTLAVENKNIHNENWLSFMIEINLEPEK